MNQTETFQPKSLENQTREPVLDQKKAKTPCFCHKFKLGGLWGIKTEHMVGNNKEDSIFLSFQKPPF